MDAAEREEFRRRQIAGGKVVDPEAVVALMALGFTERAALMALRAVVWRGDITAERVINALLTVPTA